MINPDINHLEALARAAGGEQWEYWDNANHTMGGVVTVSGEEVTIGNMDGVAVEPDNGKFIAAANPAALLALTAQVRQLTAERNELITQRNAANVRALKAEFPAVPGLLRAQADVLRAPPPELKSIELDQAELARLMKDWRPGPLMLVTRPSQEEFDLMQARAETAEEVVNGTLPPLVACPQCYTCFDPRTNAADRLDDVLPLPPQFSMQPLVDHATKVSIEALQSELNKDGILEIMPITQGEGEYGKFQRHIENKIANAFAGRIKPLPLNLPESLDLPDTEGGAHD